MRKQLGMLMSFLFVGAMALIGYGCCTDNRCCDISPVCEQPCRPVCPPQCGPICPQPALSSCPAPACGGPAIQAPGPTCGPDTCHPATPCRHPNANELRCHDFITVIGRNPKLCLLGDEYPIEFDVHACADVCDVAVTTHLPAGVTLIRSEPEACVEGNKLTWYFGSMQQGECRSARVIVKCECEGEQCACFCATATPVRFCSLLCAKPILTCHKCGPEQVCPGDPVNYTITVTNRGTCAAEDVVVVDNIPSELEHATGARSLTFRLGTIEACQTKTVNVCLRAIKRGNACNTAVVSACNADSVSCQWCTCICCCAVDIVKEGPREVPIGKNADYQITVTNTGDLDLTDVVVTDFAPMNTSIVAANGATINGNEAVWRVREMKPGEKVNFTLTLTTCTPGCASNRAHVATAQGCQNCAELSTRWRGRPTLNLCIVQSDSPICIGERTTYTVDVVNQGSEPDANVNVVVRFPDQLRPVSASGDTPGQVSGQTVTFQPYGTLKPRQTIRFRVDAEAVASGDARVVVEVSSENTRSPILQQESTIVN